MKFVKWTIFIAFFAFAENAPTTEEPSSEDESYINVMNNFTSQIGDPKSQYFNAELQRNKIKFITFHRTIMTWLVPKNSSNTSVQEEILISLEVHLQDFASSFETEIFLCTVIAHLFTQNMSIATEYPDLDQHDIKLKLPNNHQYKPNEENKIKQETKKLLKIVFDQKIQEGKPALFQSNTEAPSAAKETLGWLASQLTRTIPGTDYTLSNITIDELGNVQKVVAYVQSENFGSMRITSGPVRGSLVQNFHSEATRPIELSFRADSFSVSTNSTLRGVYASAEGYSFINVESNTTLTDDQSKSIMRRIESASVSIQF